MTKTKTTPIEKTVLRAPLGILATATATHGTGRDDDIPLPRLPGFVESAFSPLAYEVSRRCLTERPGGGTSRSEAESGGGSRTAVALASLLGDTTTADLASRRMVSGKVHNPLLFMQATPNSVLGHISREFGITGQMFSISTFDDPVTELLTMADLLLEDPELDRVLVLGVELGGSERLAAMHRELAAGYREPAAGHDSGAAPGLPASAGLAAAVLLGRCGAGASVTVRSAETPGPDAGPIDRPGGIQRLFDLAAAHRRLLRDGGNLLLPGPAAFVLTADTADTADTTDDTETHAHQ
ncbi:hypothetical protein [Streptomyces sp. TRM70350]|uniref:hypothetical protein n=1 Tax=Streptomyces sp. TRM70350 TaxID=2856165 RepID=UPI001C4483FC|nr:hypothetical protein [Streptomyces sp. TRM70350]MBV7696199.1 hypothetical protein [Streptomyces sp. TRM70350]